MTHPSFDIISKLGRSEFCKPDLAALQAFRHQVWDMPVYIPGERIDLPDRRNVTRFSLNKGHGTAFPSLFLYMREADAVAMHGPGQYFEARFHLAMLFSDSYRADVRLSDAGDSLLIPHEKLLELRDMANTGDWTAAQGAEEIAAQRDAMLAFVLRARTYCARHADDVASLHLATLTTPGAKPMLVGSLHAERYARHALALNEISMDLFRPGWRFLLCEEASGHAELIRNLQATPPCYVKVAGQGWWSKLKRQFATPVLPPLGLQLR
jgi:hypothetical protein